MVALPYATYCYSFGRHMLREWKLKAGKGTSGHFLRILKTLKAISFNFGSFRELNDESKLVYIESIIGKVLDGILFFNSSQNDST